MGNGLRETGEEHDSSDVNKPADDTASGRVVKSGLLQTRCSYERQRVVRGGEEYEDNVTT